MNGTGRGPIFPESDPSATGLHAEWYEANRSAAALTAQRCRCGVWRHPARIRCAVCAGDVWEFVRLGGSDAGRGAAATVGSWTMTRRTFHPAFADAVPYPIVVAECAHRLRFFVQLRGTGDVTPSIGDPVVIEVDGFGVPYAVAAGRSLT